MNPFATKAFLIRSILVLITLTTSITYIGKSKLNRSDKLFWIIMVLLFNVFGTLVYFVFGRK